MQKDFAPRFYHLTFCLYTPSSLHLYHYAWVSLMDHLGSHYMLPSLLRCLTFDTFTLQNTNSDSEPGALQFFCLNARLSHVQGQPHSYGLSSSAFHGCCA